MMTKQQIEDLELGPKMGDLGYPVLLKGSAISAFVTFNTLMHKWNFKNGSPQLVGCSEPMQPSFSSEYEALGGLKQYLMQYETGAKRWPH